MPRTDQFVEAPNETEATCSRVTKEGRHITYKLRVIQQPERARACGSGAKSSADRRPVDPPPIIELLILEGEKADADITFAMNANYFLFATLEVATRIAPGREDEQQKLTVLTGTPVAGLVYLDRPKAAGYFLFPDLSVRHEGEYRLSFNLYEELKEEKDGDKVEDPKAKAVGPSHVCHRLELRSRPFRVWSAKRFPGLDRSTELSRMVAEQGCRVRIRREIRVKKRGEDGKEYEVYEDDGGEVYTPARGTHALAHRQRSRSMDSHRSIAPAVSRHASREEINATYHQAGMPQAHAGMMHAPYEMSYGRSMAGYSTAGHAPPYAAVAMHPHQLPPSGYYAPAPDYHSISPTAASPEDPSQPAVEPRRIVPPPTLPPPRLHTRISPPAQTPTPRSSPTDGGRTGTPSASQARAASFRMLPAIDTGPHIPSQLLDPSSPNSATQSPNFSDSSRSFRGGLGSADSGIHVGTKRGFGDAFDTLHLRTPLRDGSRPAAPGVVPDARALDPDDGPADDDPPAKMQYRRADGREILKLLH